MKLKFFSVVTIVSAMMFTACDETTDTIGTSLTDNMDMLEVSTDTFELTSKSVVVDSVLSRNTTGYLGKSRIRKQVIILPAILWLNLEHLRIMNCPKLTASQVFLKHLMKMTQGRI